jgi:protein-arginine kinase
MSNRLDPIARSAVKNASELGLVLSEINTAEVIAKAHQLRAEVHAELWGRLFRSIGRLFGRKPVQIDEARRNNEPVLSTPLANDNDSDSRIAA